MLTDAHRARLKHPVSSCASCEKKLQLRAVTIRKGSTAAALCGGAALVFAVGLGVTGADQPLTSTTSASTSAVPAPPSPGDGAGGGALPVQPAGGGACIIGLNCGCIPHRTCPTPHAVHPGNAGANQHTAPAPQNP
jgi:hypothetical protein